MASGFKFIAVEIPRDITIEFVSNIKRRIFSITIEQASIFNAVLDLDITEIEIDDVCEEDLFHIGEDSLKIKKAVVSLLDEAVDQMIVPRINAESRVSTPVGDKSFAYLEIEGKLYIASGESDAYYSTKVNLAYLHLLGLNISGILKGE